MEQPQVYNFDGNGGYGYGGWGGIVPGFLGGRGHLRTWVRALQKG